RTFAVDFPTKNAFQGSNRGSTNIFVTKFDPTGHSLIFSTYLGGNGFDEAAGVAVDSAGNAYVTGSANSFDFPTTAGSFMTSCPGSVTGGESVFLEKILPNR